MLLENRDLKKDAAYEQQAAQEAKTAADLVQLECIGYTLEQLEAMEGQYYYNQITSI